MSDSAPLWGYRECAAAIGTAESTLRAYRSDGRLPEPDEVVMGHPRWDPDRFMRWHAGRPGRGNWRRG